MKYRDIFEVHSIGYVQTTVKRQIIVIFPSE
jgi:hypothetical protein